MRAQHRYGAQVTGAGTVLFHAESRCSTGFGPGFNNCPAGETQIVRSTGESFSVPGFLLASPSERFGVFATFDRRVLWVDWFTGEETRVELLPFQSIPNVTPPFSVNRHAIANNGSFLIADGTGLRVWSKSGEIVLPTTDLVQRAVISADSGTVAITTRERDDFQNPNVPTYLYHLASGRKTKFFFFVSLSEDGQTVAHLSEDVNQLNARAQVMISRSDGTAAARQITSEPAGVRTAILSGDARYLYVVAGRNAAIAEESRIRRHEITTGAIDDIPAIP